MRYVSDPLATAYATRPAQNAREIPKLRLMATLELLPDPLGAEPRWEKMHAQRAGGHAEEPERHGHECEVVPGHHTANARRSTSNLSVVSVRQKSPT
jgi:hypothetical protein